MWGALSDLFRRTRGARCRTLLAAASGLAFGACSPQTDTASRATPTAGSTPPLALPVGITTFYEGSACPEGWRPVPDSAGRLILGTGNQTLYGKTAGRPLGDQEDRGHHSHDYPASLTLKERSISGAAGPNHAGARKGRSSAKSQVEATSSGLPMYQIPFCEALAPATGASKSSGPEGPAVATASPVETGTWPELSIAFFRSPTCPTPWVPYEKGHGRFIVPLTNQSQIGRAVGTPLTGLQPPPHRHGISTKLTLSEQRYALLSGCCNKHNLAQRGKGGQHELSGDIVATETDIPTMALSVCMLPGPEPHRPPLPAGFTVFSGARHCPVEQGWQEVLGSKGRYLVALPEGGDAGVAFGGAPLADLEMREHAHQVSGSVTLPDYGVAGVSGCSWFICGKSYVQAGTYRFNARTKPAAVQMPYVPLTQCVLR